MIPEYGNLALYLAAALSVISSNIGHKPVFRKYLPVLWLAIFFFSFSSLMALVFCYINSDFTVLNVINNSHTTKPLIYKIAGAWGNHEGSMLLWISAMAFFSFAFAVINRKKDRKEECQLIALTLSVQSILCAFFIGFTIFFSNPFERVFPPPINGYGLNPILQDIGLAMHPPILYLGYVGFSIAYSASIAGLLLGDISKAWAHIILPWIFGSWIFLGIGIGLGSWWAYRELGWGGFWFWDPVENASLMPWLTALALIHTTSILQKTGEFGMTSAILGLATFSLSMIGTFIVRSGLITSVHSFVLDPSRGVIILLFLGAMTIAACVIYVINWKISKTVTENKWRNVAIMMNTLILMVMTFMILLGTLYPKLLEWLGVGMISIGPPYFNTLGGIFAVIMMCCMALTSQGYAKTLEENYTKILQYHFYIFLIAILLGSIITAYSTQFSVIALMLATTSIWALLANLKLGYFYRKKFAAKIWSSILGHFGAALLLFSVSINALFAVEADIPLKIGEKATFHGLEIYLNDVYIGQKYNYIAKILDLKILSDTGQEIILNPEIRIYPIEKQQTLESAVMHAHLYDLYIAAMDINQFGNAVLRVYYKPMMRYFWLSILVIVTAGLHSIKFRKQNS